MSLAVGCRERLEQSEDGLAALLELKAWERRWAELVGLVAVYDDAVERDDPGPEPLALIERVRSGVAEPDRLAQLRLDYTTQSTAWRLFRMAPGWSCSFCGCSDDNCAGCIERTGKACHWVRPGICSACT